MKFGVESGVEELRQCKAFEGLHRGSKFLCGDKSKFPIIRGPIFRFPL